MALGLPTAADAADRTPVLKYDARAGRIFRVDRTQGADGWTSNPVEIPSNVFQAVMDVENIETGWLHFPTGGAPDIKVVPINQPFPEKPSDKHRSGFRIIMLLGKTSGGDVREMAANAQVSIQGMDALHDLYAAGVKANPGKLPVVVLESTIPVTSSGKGADGKPVSSTNYKPVWGIVKWVDRPAELTAGHGGGAPPAAAAPAPEPAPAAAAPAAAAGAPADKALVTSDF